MAPRKDQPMMNIYVQDGGKGPVFIQSMDLRIANHMSPAIRKQLKKRAFPKDRQGAVFYAPCVDRESARNLADWVNEDNTCGILEDQVLALNHVNSDRLSDLVHLYVAATHLGISRDHRGDGLHDLIVDHVKTAHLSAPEFKLVHEMTGFEPGIFSKLLRAYVELLINGDPPPQTDEIFEYCKDASLGRRMDRIQHSILNGN